MGFGADAFYYCAGWILVDADPYSQLQYRHGICGVMGVWAAIAVFDLWGKCPCLAISLTEIFDFL
jgi:hypothetical protein